MPVIHARSDGEFYIKEKSKRSGQFITWQMNEKCCQYLQKYSLLEDKGKIQGYTVNLFRLLGYVYTKNIGYDEITTIGELKFPTNLKLLTNAERALIKELRILLNSVPKGATRKNKAEQIKAALPSPPKIILDSPPIKTEKTEDFFNRNKSTAFACAYCKICKKTLGINENCCQPLARQVVICEICGSEEAPESILLHMMRHGREYCVFCKRFVTKEKFSEHFAGHLLKNTVFCFDCDEKIHKKRIEGHIEWHKRKLDDGSVSFFFCGVCGEICKKSQIRMHINLIHKQKMSKFFHYLGAVSFQNEAIKNFAATRSEIIDKKLHLKPLYKPKKSVELPETPKGLIVSVKKKKADEIVCPLCKKSIKAEFYRNHLRISHGVE